MAIISRQVVTDAHIHMGYYTRNGYDEPFYYSPRRVIGLMNRCGIKEFIVSSTNSQVECISLEDIIREAIEMRWLAGGRVHQFLWLSGRLYDKDKSLKVLDLGLYEGVKLHEMETPWISARKDDLKKILNQVEKRGLKVQFHCSAMEGCRPNDLKMIAKEFPSIKFDFAHCCLMNNIISVMENSENVFTDTAMFDDYASLRDVSEGVRKRIMYGSDFPAYHVVECDSFSREYRKRVVRAAEECLNMNLAFCDFLK